MYVLCLPRKFFIYKGNCTFGRKEQIFWDRLDIGSELVLIPGDLKKDCSPTLGQGPSWSMADKPSDSPWKITNFSYIHRYQLQSPFCLGVTLCPFVFLSAGIEFV